MNPVPIVVPTILPLIHEEERQRKRQREKDEERNKIKKDDKDTWEEFNRNHYCNIYSFGEELREFKQSIHLLSFFYNYCKVLKGDMFKELDKSTLLKIMSKDNLKYLIDENYLNEDENTLSLTRKGREAYLSFLEFQHEITESEGQDREFEKLMKSSKPEREIKGKKGRRIK